MRISKKAWGFCKKNNKKKFENWNSSTDREVQCVYFGASTLQVSYHLLNLLMAQLSRFNVKQQLFWQGRLSKTEKISFKKLEVTNWGTLTHVFSAWCYVFLVTYVFWRSRFGVFAKFCGEETKNLTQKKKVVFEP